MAIQIINGDSLEVRSFNPMIGERYDSFKSYTRAPKYGNRCDVDELRCEINPTSRKGLCRNQRQPNVRTAKNIARHIIKKGGKISHPFHLVG